MISVSPDLSLPSWLQRLNTHWLVQLYCAALWCNAYVCEQLTQCVTLFRSARHPDPKSSTVTTIKLILTALGPSAKLVHESPCSLGLTHKTRQNFSAKAFTLHLFGLFSATTALFVVVIGHRCDWPAHTYFDWCQCQLPVLVSLASHDRCRHQYCVVTVVQLFFRCMLLCV